MTPPEELTEEVVEKIVEAVPEFVDSTNALKVKFGLLGAVVGASVGGAAAWFVAYRRAIGMADARADAEISEMREHYQAKGRALEAQAGKGDLEALVKEKGYTASEPDTSVAPMAVQPPKSVILAEPDAADVPDDSAMGENDVEGANGVKLTGEAAVRNVFRDHSVAEPYVWDKYTELRRRTPDAPYVIHYDERNEMEGYSDVSFTYYAKDDVLCDERDEVIDPIKRDDLVGDANLDRFGHGSGDETIVFVRNDNLEMVFEIIRSPNSFAEEVHGFSHESYDRGNLERMRRRERDEDI